MPSMGAVTGQVLRGADAGTADTHDACRHAGQKALLQPGTESCAPAVTTLRELIRTTDQVWSWPGKPLRFCAHV